MSTNGIRYIFISPDFDRMMALKKILEREHNTLTCDTALSYNSCTDYSGYSLLLADIFKLTEYPLKFLESLHYGTHTPIAVLAPPEQMDVGGAQMYRLGADAVLPAQSMETVAAFLGTFYNRYVFHQHQEQIRHRATMVFRDELVIEPKCRRVTLRGEALELTAQDYELLNYLACNADITVTYEMIADRIWGSSEVTNNTIFSAITRLRKKIEPDPQNPIYIRTVYSVGYCFDSHVNCRNL